MTYVMSDIHGMYDKYAALLKDTSFSRQDTLFVLGNVLDRGPDPCGVLLDMSCRENVFPILGDLEFLAAVALRKLREDPDAADEEGPLSPARWLRDGGDITWRQFYALSKDDQDALLDYLEEFSLYEVVTAGEQKYILVHAGLGNYSPEKKLSQYTPAELLYGPNDYTRSFYGKSVLVTGHVPTNRIGEAWRGRVFHGPRQLGINCGAAEGGRLAMVCLDTGEEFYA